MHFIPTLVIITRVILVSWFSVTLCLNVLAQSQLTDSLEHTLEGTSGKRRVDLLNQLTYEFITHDNKKVVLYGSEAIRLSKEIQYLAGEARAYAYKGVYEYQTAQFEDSHRDLHRALRLAAKAGERTLEGYALLQLGNCSLEEVQNDSALIFFKQSYTIFKDSSDPTTLSKLYRNIGALYGQKYQTDSQRVFLERAIRIRKLLPDKTLLADALILKANISVRLGDFATAEQILNEADAIVTRYPQDDENRNDIRHMRALILFQKGNFEEAVVLFDSARNFYLRTSLLRKYVTLLADLGKVFSDRGEYELALNNLYDGLRLSKLKSFNVETSLILGRIGWVNYHLGDLDQALLMADEALNVKVHRSMLGDQATALVLKGVVLTGLKDFPSAKTNLDAALSIYQKLQNQKGICEAIMNLGNLAAKSGQLEEAIQLFQRGEKLAQAIPFNFGLAWCYWGLGDAYFRLGAFANAAHFLDLSEQHARLVGSTEILILNFNTRRDLLKSQSRYKESLQFSILASQLKDSIHRTDVARRFVNLARIQEIEQRDRDIKNLQRDKQLVEERLQLQDARIRQQSILLTGGVISFLLLAVLTIVYYRFYNRIKVLHDDITEKNKRIQAQADKLQEVNEELGRLYKEVSQQKEMIQLQANELTDSNRGLEKIVAQKTQELRNTNDELVKYNSELLQFSYTVSHNLRGPVARLLGLSDLVSKERELSEAKQWISLISKTAADLDQIIKDLSQVLDLRNMPHQYRERVSLEQEWNQSKSLLQDSLTGREEIVTHFEEVPEIITVRPMLQSIFYNLLSNAIKFRSPERALRVEVTSRIQNEKVVLEVSDNGLGFDTALHREKIFKLYRRFHTHVEGRGLGLYLIKSQLDVLHGDIEVESEPNSGSLFRILLPLIREEHLIESAAT